MVVLVIASVTRLNISELWIAFGAFGAGKGFRFISAHEIARALGPDRCEALLMFHAYTGCDTVSFFGGTGKRLHGPPGPPIETSHQHSAPWVPYQIHWPLTSRCNHRSNLWFPPTRDARIEHTKRAACQADNCWAQIMTSAPELPSPREWGWNKNPSAGWSIIWMTLPEAAETCRELLQCGSKAVCRGRCKCRKAALRCTNLCPCGGVRMSWVTRITHSQNWTPWLYYLAIIL